MSEEKPASDTSEQVSFGFESVSVDEKVTRVRGVFASVAKRYDLMNDLMSGGVHRLWKDQMVAELRPRAGWQLLDVAGGTGDIAFRIVKQQPKAAVTICDLTPDMLTVGRDRALDHGLLQGLHWVAGNAEQLPFPDASVDAYTIAFGLRNVPRIDLALAEARRVLKPGGRFLCLEFSHVVLPGLDKLYDLYSFQVLPRLGQLVAGDRDSYQYLVESIRRFPKQQDLLDRMAAAGLVRGTVKNFSGGIAALHSGWRV